MLVAPLALLAVAQPPPFNCTSQAAGAFKPIILKNGNMEAR
jgi:hypothetical protein